MLYTHTRVENRKIQRISVGWTGTCTIGATRITGTILDVSTNGGFLGIRAATNPAQIPVGLSVIEPDETGSLSFLIAGQDAMDINMLVRWVGYSKVHGCHGVGFEFAA